MHVGVTYTEINAEQAGQRLDNFLLTQLKGLPKSRMYRLVRKGEVRINGKRVAASYRLCANDRLRLPPVFLPEQPPKPVNKRAQPSLSIAYEDEALLVIDKPAGLASHGGSGISLGAIELARVQFDRPNWQLVHRLDRDTSGLLIIAKKRSALVGLHQLFRTRTIRKNYLVAVRGRILRPELDIRAALEKHTDAVGDKLAQVSEQGKRAHTVFTLLATNATMSLLNASLYTGRMHQIRAHLTHINHPVLGDGKYGDFTLNHQLRNQGQLSRMFLHAHQLQFKHPLTQESLALSAPLPEALALFVQQHFAIAKPF